jgi:hypothetical protein
MANLVFETVSASGSVEQAGLPDAPPLAKGGRRSLRMRLAVLGATLLILSCASGASAQDDVKAVLDKAVKAHGGKENLAKIGAVSSKSKGSIDLFGGLPFSQESISVMPKQFKETIFLEINGAKATIVTVFNDGKGWADVNGTIMDLDEKTLEEIKQAGNLMMLGTLRFVDDKDCKVTFLGESKVEGKPVVGVKVARQGYRDANLYFSKETGLLSKVERQTYDTNKAQDTAEERLILDYQDVGGAKIAKKILVRRDGKKYLEAEVTEYKALDKVDPAEFAKP